MLWQFLAVLIAASALVYLGSLSIWVTVLATSVKALLAMIAAGLVAFTGIHIWRRYRADRTRLIGFKP